MISNLENISNDFDDISSDNTMQIIKTLKFKKCKINDTIYNIPKTLRKPQYYFFSVILHYNENQIITDSDSNTLVEPYSANKYTLQIEFDNLYPKSSKQKVPEVIIALYRMGQTSPISVTTIDSNTLKQTLLSSRHSFNPGTYFILICNAEPVDNEYQHFKEINYLQYFYFQILPHGYRLKHPILTGGNFSEDHIIELYFNNAITTDDNCYSILCYDKNNKIMATPENVPYKNLNHTMKINTKIKTNAWWLDNDYTFIILHNDEPFAVFTFQWSNGHQIGQPICTQIEKDTPLYMQAKLTKYNFQWKYLSRFAGYSEIRKGILNIMCKQNKQIQHYAICTSQSFDNHRIASIAAVINPNSIVKCYDCTMLLEDYQEPAINITDNQFICLHNIASLLTTEGKRLLNEVETNLKIHSNFKLIIYGNSDELNQLFKQSPIISEFIPLENRWQTQPFSLQEQINECRTLIEDHGIKFSITAQKALIKLMTENKDKIKNWRDNEITRWVEHTILTKFRERIVYSLDWTANETFFTTLDETDIQLAIDELVQNSFEMAITQLNEMIGLTEIKKSLITTFNRTRFDHLRKQFGFPSLEKSGYHMIFTGNPGTGKTTVAKLIGNIFHSMGLLSIGNVIEAERSDMIGKYIGETEDKMKELLKRAKGNVLFIDEAYTLCDNNDNDRKDYGCRALECLLTVLTEKNPDILVIMAGYEKDIERMLSLNLGMRGRFPYRFHFEDYNEDELYQIAWKLLDQGKYILTPEDDSVLKETIHETIMHKDDYFHNARWIEQYILDGVISSMANRLMSLPSLPNDKTMYQTIEVQDIKEAYQNMNSKSHTSITKRKRIGFVA